MNIIGEKVILRALEPQDKDMLLSIINDPETEYMLGGWAWPVSSAQQEAWMQSQKQTDHLLRCIVESKETGEAIGMVALTDIDYKNGTAQTHSKLISSARGKGYGTDTRRTILRYAFQELRLRCVYNHIAAYNIASQKVNEKLGFQKEGILRHRIFKRGKSMDMFSYSILAEEFEQASG
jgi:RimJ/RimL family protein N-acetyltransferase